MGMRHILLLIAALGAGYAVSERRDDIKELLAGDSSKAMVSQLFESEDFKKEKDVWGDFKESVPVEQKDKETRNIPPGIMNDEWVMQLKSPVAVPTDLNGDGVDELIVYDGLHPSGLRVGYIYQKYRCTFQYIGGGFNLRIGKERTKSGFHVIYGYETLRKKPRPNEPLVIVRYVRDSDNSAEVYSQERLIGLAPDKDTRQFLEGLKKRNKKNPDGYRREIEIYRQAFGDVQTARMLIGSEFSGVDLFDERTYNGAVKKLLGNIAGIEHPEQYSTEALIFGIAVDMILDEHDPLRLRKGLPPFSLVFAERERAYQEKRNYIETPGGRVKVWTPEKPWGYRQGTGGGTTYEPKPMHYDVAEQYERVTGRKPSNAEMNEMQKWGTAYTIVEPPRNK